MIYATRRIATWAAATAPTLCGCGLIEVERTLFPNQATAADGSALFFEDIEDITSDTDLLADEVEDALRDLELRSEALITAIVEDGLGSTPATTPPSDGTDDNAIDGTDSDGNGDATDDGR